MQRRSSQDASAPRRTGVKHLARRAALAGLLSTAVLGAGAQASLAQTTLEVGVANNIYPALKDMSTHLADEYDLTPFSFNVAAQLGGFWNKPAIDTTTLRGITSGNLRQQLKAPGPYTGCDPTSSNNCVNGPLQIDAFLSADESNVNQVIPTGSNGGSCTASGNTVCPGLGATKTAVAIGKLAVYRCSATYASDGASQGSPESPVGAVNGSGNGVPTSPRCQASPVTLSANTVAGVLDWLDDAPANRISIADPNSAPFGAAARQALISAGFSYVDAGGAGAGQNVWPAATCNSQASGVCKVRLEAGISQVRGAVGSGTVRLGLAALSNLKHITWGAGSTLTGTTSDDPNPWFPIPASAYSLYGPIAQYGVCIRRSTPNSAREAACTEVLSEWNDDTVIQNTLLTYGYTP